MPNDFIFLQVGLSKDWKEIYELSRIQGLRDSAFAVMDIVKKSKSDATNKKYDSYFSKFKLWCGQFNMLYLPANVSTVSLYLTSLIQAGCSVAVLRSNFYAIKWYHKMYLFEDPCSSNLTNLVYEGGKRILSQPVHKKEPITADIIIKMFHFYKNKLDLYNCRSLCMFLLAYAGFFRFQELSHIRMSDISFHNTHIEILVPSSKTDIYRQGNSVVIAKTNTETCPVAFLHRYISLADLSNSTDFIFRSLSYNKSTHKHILLVKLTNHCLTHVLGKFC